MTTLFYQRDLLKIKKLLLMLTHSTGYKHDYIPTAIETVKKKLADSQGIFQTVNI